METPMTRLHPKSIVASVALLGLLALSGCASTGSIDSSDELAKAVNGSEKLIFGKFRLVRNGEEADLGAGLFATTAELHVVNGDGERDLVGKVGKDGEFAWALEPGTYQVTTIGFDNRGEREETGANFAFTVPADYDAVYVGTITLEASFDSGWYGTNGAVDNMFISNDCERDCAERMETLGLSMDTMTVSVFESRTQMARTN